MHHYLSPRLPDALVAKMSSSGSPTPTTASASQTNLFPSSTRSSTPDGNRSTNVYYLVVSSAYACLACARCSSQFLGVLVILLLLAACLAFRAFRIRRRYRTATQIALARGGPLPNDPGNEFWGMGGMAGWTAENTVRIDAGGRRGRKTTRWAKIPILWENEVYEKVSGAEEDLDHGFVGTHFTWCMADCSR